jgi:DNA-binding Xre family transcriptional regulator
MITSNVKYIMRKKEITIHKLTELTKLSDHSVLKARTSRIKGCKLETLEKIAKVLDCKVKDLFEEEPDKAKR